MTSQTTAPAIIHKLVETFEQNLDSYRSSKNETELRREFLDKFFTALGWDVANEKGYDELGKEVIHEFSVDVAGQQKKADYAFRVGRGEKFDFLVEAKKPSVKIESSQEAAFQIRRYGWSAKLPINILSDFEHLAVYDCRTKPSYNDKASMGRIMLIHYKDYVSRWNEIVEIFSPEAVRKGSFAKYAEGMKGKKGTADVDDAFLQEIERWRELLAKNIALRNDDIDIAGLNYSVQMTIDRIVFLRICEERGIEPENQLLEIANNENSYDELCELFKRADTKYNSGLFHFKNEKEVISRPDDLTLSLAIDDKILKDIISNLYYPKSPYAFLYIPSDILGQVYERFLGKVIRLTAGHSAKVEEKPEVRKAGGVYYTPTYIVEYIVKNTVGKLVEKKSPKDIASLKIVDPACGSGTFLLGAYQFLLDWHLNWYVENEPEKAEKNKIVVKVGEGYRLSTAKKKEILLNNIHGLDIDAQAVEVTKLSLLLKVLENASGQLGLGMERVLPDLGNNIKCGNSLIGFDYFEGQLFPSEEEQASINPFDWRNEFKDVFAKGGFDVVIGNPPYSAKQSLETKQLSAVFPSVEYKCDPYAFFIEQGLRKLRNGGLLGFIIPVTWMTNFYYMKIRKLLIDSNSLSRVILLDGLVFEDANVDTCMMFLNKDSISDEKFEWLKTTPDQLEQPFSYREYSKVRNEERYDIVPNSDDSWNELRSKIDKLSIKLGAIAKISLGMKLRSNDEFVIFEKDKKHPDGIYFGADISRYGFCEPKRFFDFSNAVIVGGTKKPEIHRTKPKILIQAIRNLSLKRRIVAALEIEGDCFVGTVNGVTLLDQNWNMKYILGLVNSTLANSYFSKRFTTISLTAAFLGEIPIRVINFSDPAEKAQHDKMVSLVEKILASHKSLSIAQTPQEKERLERQIEVTDKAIDSLVYELYGLNEEEIKILEGE